MTLTEDSGESGILPPGFFFLCLCLSQFLIFCQ